VAALCLITPINKIRMGTGNTVPEIIPAKKGNWSELWLKGGKLCLSGHRDLQSTSLFL